MNPHKTPSYGRSHTSQPGAHSITSRLLAPEHQRSVLPGAEGGDHVHRIAVVRHGQTRWNQERRIQGRSNLPLNELGQEQAREAAHRLADLGAWDRLLASPLLRAQQTAAIIASGLSLPPATPCDALVERDYGSAEGLRVPEAEERWPGLRINDAESVSALAERAATTLHQLLTASPGSVLVSHGAFLRAGLTQLTGTPVPRIENGVVVVLTLDPAGAVHLSELPPDHLSAGG